MISSECSTDIIFLPTIHHSGGYLYPVRKMYRLDLSLNEREEIYRRLEAKNSIKAVANKLL